MANPECAERVKAIIVEQLGVSAEDVTESASFIEDLGADSLDIVELVMALEEIRRVANTAIIVQSGYRCEKHNAEVGGERNSQHMTGRAADISSRIGVDRLRDIARGLAWVNGIGYDPARGMLHVDVRMGKRAEWTYVNGKAV